MCFQYIAFPAGMSFVMITWAQAAHSEEQGDKSLKHGRVLPKLMLLTKPFNHSSTFFYHSTGRHDKEYILNMELMLFCLQCKDSIYVVNYRFLWENVTSMKILIGPLFITFVDLSTKCKIFILCFLMFLSYLMVSHNFHTLTFVFSSPVPSEMMD
jgi:hypothetical protein